MFQFKYALCGLSLLTSYTAEGLGLRCLRCDDVSEPRFCERIEYCQDGDVCAVQWYQKENGDTSFWTGCQQQSSCPKVTNRTIVQTNKRKIHGSVLCQECCYGDLCNAEGCGAPAYPTSRGPICFNCAHTLNPSDCHHVTLCGTNEMCFLGERPVFGQRYFTSHCEDIHACENHVSAPIIVGRKRSLRGHRSYAPCSGCCQGDLCNINCNASFTSGTIINTGTTGAPTHMTEISGNYAFYAHLTSSTTNNYVIFNNVTTNEGLAYNGSTGIFTCKYSGPYVFSWTIATSNQRYTGTDLLINDVALGSSFTDSRGSRVTADSSTGFVVYNLKFGDKVRVKVNGTANAMLSTFSGWRLNYNDAYFYARASTSLTRPTSISYGFSFQNVITNNGHVYHSGNGTFVCPESGLYAFAFSVEAHRQDFMVYFYRNGHKLNELGVWPDSSSGPYEDTSSTLQLFSLTPGDRVYLYTSESGSTLEPIHSTFSGWHIGSTTSTPAFLQMASDSTSSSPAYYNTEYLDTTNSFYHTQFQTPKDGVYLFFWNMEANGRHHRSWIQVNSESVGETISDGRNADYDSGSDVAILRLERNDIITVKQDGAADGDQTMISGYFMFS
ncbi:uncharacterized protein LOC133194312 [Saccostrea echinata]|uniref:uncharacterized protein LOC133194312 n=1 Tax=Saccostrea echinata TaxID=191078 RepID=UPI002A81D6A4|nr:uncharacterized protein LOC133194312 [Saccostrea echinata]